MKRSLILLALVGVVAGCGAAQAPVPNVVGERLDVAKSAMGDAGYDTESLGGGTFGVVDESNWTVCETRPGAGATDSGMVKLVVDRTCEAAGAAIAETTSPAAEPTASKHKAAAKRRKAAATGSGRIRVPNVVGMDHQLAQDTMQASGLYMLAERDASGQARLLVYDRNWTVVRQSPKPGARVSEDRTITLNSTSRTTVTMKSSMAGSSPGWSAQIRRLAFWVTALTALILGVGIGGARATNQSTAAPRAERATKLGSDSDAIADQLARVTQERDDLKAKAESTETRADVAEAAAKRLSAKGEVPSFLGDDAASARDNEIVDELGSEDPNGAANHFEQAGRNRDRAKPEGR